MFHPIIYYGEVAHCISTRARETPYDEAKKMQMMFVARAVKRERHGTLSKGKMATKKG